MKRPLLSILAVMVLFPTGSLAAEGKCDYIFSDSSTTVLHRLVGKEALGGVRLYPKGALKRADQHIMFGFESEYTLGTSAELLKVYMPRKEFGVSRESWLAKTDEARIAWVKDYFSTLEQFDKDSGLILIESIKGMDFLPQSPIRDATGNVEIVLNPVNDFSTLSQQVLAVNKRFGAGSMQAMISSPKGFFFESGRNSPRGKIGLFTLMAEADALQKLRGGADRYLKDASKDVARSFAHPFLGPMSRLKQGRLKMYLDGNAKNELFDKDSLGLVAGRDDSFKYTGTSAYRPDIGGSRRVSVEVRDAHVNEALLLEKTQRITAMMMRGTQRFEKFSELSSLDTGKVFDSMPEGTRFMLKELFPAKIKEGDVFSKDEVFSHEAFRNFSYPMRDWKPFLELMGKERYLTEVKSEQAKYLSRLKVIERDLTQGNIAKDEASRRVQGALALFAKDSALHEHFENFIYQNL